MLLECLIIRRVAHTRAEYSWPLEAYVARVHRRLSIRALADLRHHILHVNKLR